MVRTKVPAPHGSLERRLSVKKSCKRSILLEVAIIRENEFLEKLQLQKSTWQTDLVEIWTFECYLVKLPNLLQDFV